MRLAQKTHFALLAAAFCGLAQGQMPSGINVSGVSLGMTIDQAKAVLGPSLAYATPPTTDPAFTALAAGKGDIDKSLLEGFLLVALDGKIVYAEHKVLAQTNQPFSVSQLKSNLFGKYGQTPSTPAQYSTLRWLFSRTGKLEAGRSANMAPCFFSGNTMVVPELQVPGVPDLIQDVMKVTFSYSRQPESCGSLVSASVDTSGYDIGLINLDALSDHAVALQRKAKEEQQSKDDAARRRQAPM